MAATDIHAALDILLVDPSVNVPTLQAINRRVAIALRARGEETIIMDNC